MIKEKPVHDTIVLVKNDTIVKIVELVNKVSEKKQSAFTQWFDDYSNVSTFFGTIATVGALVVAIIAIYKTTNDSRKQVLAHKIEEIYELIVTLSVMYVTLHSVYEPLEESNVTDITANERLNLKEKFFELNGKLKGKMDLDDLLRKSRRLNILANTYLKGHLKFDVIGYSQLFIAIIYILKYGDIKQREPEFNEPLPTPENLYNFGERINQKLVLEIGYGNDNEGFLNYRNTIFKTKIHPNN